jgi:L-threonylcarbamoyladenylate synthase
MSDPGIIRFNRAHPSVHSLQGVLRHLAGGGVAVLPTETQYALSADATSNKGLARVRLIKGRPEGQPFSVFFPDRQALADWGITLPEWAESLAEAFWPGPMTLILPTRSKVFRGLGGGRQTVGVRVSPEPLIHQLCRKLDRPLVATSANPSGLVLSSRAENLWLTRQVAEHEMIWARPAIFRRHESSTILDCSGNRVRLVRDGAIPAQIWKQALTAERLGPAQRDDAN